MKSLRIVKAKPNPAGKDRHGPHTPAAQLAAEWVDFINDGTEAFPLEPIVLYHVAYQPGCRDPKWDKLMPFKGTLSVGKTVRVHSGNELPLNQMHPEDASGADHHLFTGRNYVWNNTCGDTAGLYNGQAFEDKATYDPYPPEASVLRRQGDKLVP